MVKIWRGERWVEWMWFGLFEEEEDCSVGAEEERQVVEAGTCLEAAASRRRR